MTGTERNFSTRETLFNLAHEAMKRMMPPSMWLFKIHLLHLRAKATGAARRTKPEREHIMINEIKICASRLNSSQRMRSAIIHATKRTSNTGRATPGCCEVRSRTKPETMAPNHNVRANELTEFLVSLRNDKTCCFQ